MLGDEPQMNEDMPLYTDFAPHAGRFVWEGRPSMEALVALKQNEGRMIITLPHPDTQEEVRALVLYVEVPDQVVMPLEDEDTGELVIPNTLHILCVSLQFEGQPLTVLPINTKIWRRDGPRSLYEMPIAHTRHTGFIVPWLPLPTRGACLYVRYAEPKRVRGRSLPASNASKCAFRDRP